MLAEQTAVTSEKIPGHVLKVRLFWASSELSTETMMESEMGQGKVMQDKRAICYKIGAKCCLPKIHIVSSTHIPGNCLEFEIKFYVIASGYF